MTKYNDIFHYITVYFFKQGKKNINFDKQSAFKNKKSLAAVQNCSERFFNW